MPAAHTFHHNLFTYSNTIFRMFREGRSVEQAEV